MGFGALSFGIYLAFMALTLSTYGWPGLSPFWTAIGAIFVVEKVVSVRRAGPRAVLVALLMVPEMLYDLFQHAVYFTSLWGLPGAARRSGSPPDLPREPPHPRPTPPTPPVP